MRAIAVVRQVLDRDSGRDGLEGAAEAESRLSGAGSEGSAKSRDYAYLMAMQGFTHDARMHD